jgi:hypothetical protein
MNRFFTFIIGLTLAVFVSLAACGLAFGVSRFALRLNTARETREQPAIA